MDIKFAFVVVRAFDREVSSLVRQVMMKGGKGNGEMDFTLGGRDTHHVAAAATAAVAADSLQ